MFIEVVRRHLESLPPEQTGLARRPARSVVGKALSLMHAQPARTWTIEELARDAGASRSVLAERFAQLVGLPPMHYLANWRMQIAAGLLSRRRQYRRHRRRDRLRLGGRLQPRLQEDGRRSALGVAPARPSRRCDQKGTIVPPVHGSAARLVLCAPCACTDHEHPHDHDHGEVLRALGDGSPGTRPADHPDRQGLHRRGGARRDRRGL